MDPKLPERVAVIEALMPALATKADLADLRIGMHKEFTAQTWRLITWVSSVSVALAGAVFFIARNVH